jgi:hypothetical protein
MSGHNIVGSEAIFERGWAARERAFAPAHGSITALPRARRARLALAFVAGVVAAFALAAALAAAPH